MSRAVVEVGPATVRGPHHVPQDLVGAATEFVDDDVGLLDERAVSVDDLWTEAMRAVVGHDDEAVAVVCPTWWPTARVERIRAAAERVTPDVVVLSRGPLLADNALCDGAAVVEIATELLVVTRRDSGAVISTFGDAAAVAARVHAAVGIPSAVLIDAPSGVEGAACLGHAIADRLRGGGIPVAWADDEAVRRAAAASTNRGVNSGPATDEPRPTAGRLRRASALAGAIVAVAVGGGFALREDTDERAATSLLVEGRIGVMVPAQWRVDRITSGPGSARLQVVSPSNGAVALHLTQSVGPSQADLAATAESLRAALDGESDDVFVGFNASDVRAGRPAVTYREVRSDRHVAWTVLVDREVRIAIGCQSPPAHEELVRDVCDRAVESAHAMP